MERSSEEMRKEKELLAILASRPKGLVNLGNTCFMSAALQLIFNCKALNYFFMFYFQPDKHINTVNPKGYQGAIVFEYYNLLKQILEKNNVEVLYPDNFHQQIKKFGDQFKGHYQNDSHEMLSYILDGILEGLSNSDKYKDMISEKNENEEDEDEQLSKKKWANVYQAKPSIITELFYGQFRSTICCSNCAPTKIFESFLSFSLPLNVFYFTCTFVYYNIKKQPVTVTIAIEKDKSIHDKKMLIGKVFDIHIDTFIIMEEQGNNKEGLICYQINPSLIWSNPIEDFQQIQNNIVKYEKKRTEVFKATNEIEKQSREITINDEESNQFILDNYFQVYLHIEIASSSWYSLNFLNYFSKKQKFIRIILVKDLTELHYHIILNYFQKLIVSQKNAKLIPITYLVGNDNGVLNKGEFYDYCIGCNEEKCKGCQVDTIIKNRSSVSPKRKIQIKVDLTQFNLTFNPLPLSVTQHHKSLEQCIKRYSNCAQLLGNWTCKKCFTSQQATKSMQIYTPPAYLLIQFKREKDSNPELITYPTQDLDLSEFIVEGAKKEHESLLYDLIGVINYSTMFIGGHYTTTVKHFNSNEWFFINDHRVYRIDEKEVVSPHAVVLLYEKKGLEIIKPLETRYEYQKHTIENSSSGSRTIHSKEKNRTIL